MTNRKKLEDEYTEAKQNIYFMIFCILLENTEDETFPVHRGGKRNNNGNGESLKVI